MVCEESKHDNLTEIELGLRYDWATCITNNGVDGAQNFFDTQAQ